MSIQANSGADRSHASRFTEFRNRLREFALAICCWPSRFKERAKQAPQPRFGVRYKPFQGGEPIAHVGGYRILGDKRKGVQPGFVAKRAWTEMDTEKLLNPGHKFHRMATKLVEKWLQQGDSDRFPDDAMLTRFIKPAMELALAEVSDPLWAFAKLWQNETASSILHQFRQNNDDTVRSREALASNIVLAVTVASQSQEDPESSKFSKDALNALITPVMRNVGGNGIGKFEQWHYVKLDYYESDKFFGKYLLPKDRSLGIIQRWFAARSAREHNKAAVREALANELMRALGIESQKLKIVRTTYEDGTPKFLLDGKDVPGFKDFAGEPLKGERYLRDGVLVRNEKRQEDRDGAATGNPVVDLSMPALGRNKIPLLLLADRDAIGFDGGNKGYVSDNFIGIDSGEALTLAHLGRRGDVKSDFSFKHPGWLPHQRYKNFSMFDQSSLAEKMEGVRQIAAAKRTGKDMALFRSYAEQFGAANPETDFSHDIEMMRSLYEGRRDDILKTFQERLAVDHFHFGVLIHEGIRERRDASLNLLDGLEKLTSPTIAVTKSGIRLAYLQIADPSKRKEWHIHQEEDVSRNIVFSCSGAPSEIRKMYAGLREFCRGKQPEGNIELSADGKEVRLRVPPGDVVAMQQLFEHAAIAKHKH